MTNLLIFLTSVILIRTVPLSTFKNSLFLLEANVIFLAILYEFVNYLTIISIQMYCLHEYHPILNNGLASFHKAFSSTIVFIFRRRELIESIKQPIKCCECSDEFPVRKSTHYRWCDVLIYISAEMAEISLRLIIYYWSLQLVMKKMLILEKFIS